ncbi:uncharacterized protein TNCV_4830751 [Trichonephila clavipes]|nr:uncharacterized protein TNCV_4830751 [Trichonephila clavipes]
MSLSPVPLKTRRIEGLLHGKSVEAQSPPFDGVWKFRERSSSSELVVLLTHRESSSPKSLELHPTLREKIAPVCGRVCVSSLDHSSNFRGPLPLALELLFVRSPYDIFVRELVAMDGIDNSEILLIDALGCPTDTLIMGALSKARTEAKILQATFDAFKFPTSEIVQFKALVTPCLPACEPADCSVRSFDGVSQRITSFGRKRRKRSSVEEDELVVVQTIHITDKFGFDRESRKMDNSLEEQDPFANRENEIVSNPTCLNMAGLVISCSLFLVAQLVVLLGWAFFWHRRTKTKPTIRKETSRSIDMIYNSRRDSAHHHLRVYKGDIESHLYSSLPQRKRNPCKTLKKKKIVTLVLTVCIKNSSQTGILEFALDALQQKRMTLMRPMDERRLLWPANEKGRGAWCGPTLVYKKVFLGDERRALEGDNLRIALKKRDLDGGG